VAVAQLQEGGSIEGGGKGAFFVKLKLVRATKDKI
jgi:hypothetical protein